MSGTTDFTKMVPGFDFLQGLMKGAGASVPGMNQWIAPTLNREELEKRIDELRTVQFWLEQNARLLSATIQTLEVQRLTLSTLETMNVPLAEMQEAMKLRVPAPSPSPVAPTPAAETGPAAAPAAGVVDPMKWWGALTQQFADLASQALKEPAGSTAPKSGSGTPKPRAARKATTTATARALKATTATRRKAA